MRFLPAILVVLLFTAAVWFLVREGPTAEPSVRARSQSETAHGVPEGVEIPVEADRALDLVEVEAETNAEDRAAREEEPLGATHLQLQGSIVVLDEADRELPPRDGQVMLVLWGDRVGERVEAPVTQGAFTVSAPVDCEVEVKSMTLDGQRAWGDQERRAVQPEMIFQVKLVPGKVLRVVDAESGLDLSQVTVVAARDWKRNSFLHPGAFKKSSALCLNETSPLELSAPASRARMESLWVGSPGYAWGRIEVDFQSALERRILLQRGTILEVTLDGPGQAPPHDAVLRVRRPAPDLARRVQETLERVAGMPDSSFPDGRPDEAELRQRLEQQFSAKEHRGPMILESSADPSLTFEGMPSGPCVVALESGLYWDSPLVLGETSLTLEAGVTSYATVSWLPPQERQLVPLAGTFHLPAEWEVQRMALRFEPLELVGKGDHHERRVSLNDMVETSPGIYRWNVAPVLPGRYEVRCFNPDFQWLIDTGLDGNENVDIVLPPPADVSLVVQDATTGEELGGLDVNWNPRRPQGIHGGSLENAAWDEENRRYSFRAPVGIVEVSVSRNQYHVEGPAEFPITPGVNELVLNVVRACGIEIRLVYEGQFVPWEESNRWEVKLKRLDDTSVHWSSLGSAKDHGQFVGLHEPGTYEVHVPEQPGFEPVEPFLVEVPAGTNVQWEVHLQERR